MDWRKIILAIGALLLLTRCESGGNESREYVAVGLHETSQEIYSFRKGIQDFTGYFVLDFPETSADYFSSPPDSFFEFPKLLSSNRDYTLVKWRKTPVAPEHRFLLEHALSVMEANDLPKERIEDFKQQSNSSDGYYAVSYEDRGAGMYDDITFYLLEPEARRLRKLSDTMSFQSKTQ